MLSKLCDAEQKYQHLEAMLSDPAVASDPNRFVAVMKEYRELTPIIEKYRQYQAAEARHDDALELLSAENDAELRQLATEDLKQAKEELEVLKQELTVMLLPRDPNDEKNVIVEIRAGAGGEEAALFAAVLYRMYSMYAAKVGYRCSLVNQNPTELGGYREVVFMIEGDGAYSRLKFESGVHRVQRVPETESQGRIQTSTATVAVLPEVEEVSIDINPADLVFESCKSSGAGGQHINKTESAVRLTHKPTGIVIECDQERSQLQNKEKALRILYTKLYDMKQKEQADEIASTRKSQVGSGDRSEKIRTYNYPQSRITDHRINKTVYTFESFLNGDIGDLVNDLIAFDTAERLRGDN